MSRIYDAMYRFGGRQRQSPALAASGTVLNGEPTVTEYSRKMCGDGVYCINFEDQLITGPLRTTAVTAHSAAAVPAPSGNMIGRKSIVLYNNGSNTVYISGDSAIPTTESFPLPASSSISFDLLSYQQLWVRTISGTSEIRVLEVV